LRQFSIAQNSTPHFRDCSIELLNKAILIMMVRQQSFGNNPFPNQEVGEYLVGKLATVVAAKYFYLPFSLRLKLCDNLNQDIVSLIFSLQQPSIGITRPSIP
jgi:hypothetical protein